MQQVKLNRNEIILFISSVTFAIYNLYGLYLIAHTHDDKSINGWLDLIFLFVLIANIVWVFKSKKWLAFISLSLCAVTIVAMVLIIRLSLTYSPPG
jgi:hypothetical protein